jgi:hypothetical protein
MKTPLKLNSIDQEHLQELYNAAGVARDELPYTPAFEGIVQGFQDRTFKNADPEQLFAAILKYTRSSSNSSTEMPVGILNEEQLKQLKIVLSRHTVAGKILPYSDEFNSARNDFNKVSGAAIPEHEFWQAIMRMNGSKRRPPARKKVAVAVKEDDGDDDGE